MLPSVNCGTLATTSTRSLLTRNHLARTTNRQDQ
jgi:hypothetical protein